MRLSQTIAIVCTSLILSIAYTNSAEAAPNSFISLKRSDVCEKTNCILVKDLIKYDNSTQAISGAFVYHSDIGDYAREKGMKDAHSYYQVFSDYTFVFVEPDQTTLTRSKVITLEKTLPPYVVAANQIKYEIDFHTDTRTIQYGMWFDEKCHRGIVGVDNGDIAKAISYMGNGCTGDIQNSEEIITEKTSRNVCLTQCQYEKWLKEAKEKSKTTFLIGNGNIVTSQHYIINLIE